MITYSTCMHLAGCEPLVWEEHTFNEADAALRLLFSALRQPSVISVTYWVQDDGKRTRSVVVRRIKPLPETSRG